MYKPREKVFWFAISTRILVLLLQSIFNNLCPDHKADAFRSPRNSSEQISIYDKSVEVLFGGLTRWDSQYYIHIAKYGYTYENSLAFFPLFPLAVRCVAFILQKILFVLNDHSAITIAAVLINFLCFVKSAVIFYDLSKRVLKSTSLAYKAAIIYCVNPASIFFSAAYSESMFAYLTFFSMLASLERHRFVWLPIGLSALVRSNGLVNLGFPLFVWLDNLIFLVFPKIIDEYRNNCAKRALILGLRRALEATEILNTVFLSLVPFVFFQIYIWISFCTEYSSTINVPEYVAVFGVENNFPMPGNESLTWCRENLPIVYSKVQEKYWNVGLFKYYQLKQIPNFILAAPILFVMLKCVFQYFSVHGIFPKQSINEAFTKRGMPNVGFGGLPPQIFVFVVHGLFLTLFSILVVHIQVSTRLLASASPLLYWYCASVMSYRNSVSDKSPDEYEESNNLLSRWKVFFMHQKRYTVNDVLVLTYFLGYLVVGCFMYSNFLPWT